MVEFDYRQERLHSGEIIFRPVAKVYLLRLDSEWVAEYFYIDSEADYTLIPYRMGRFLFAVFALAGGAIFMRLPKRMGV